MTMEINPTVSVVMSVYNGERFLKEAIESILRQAYQDFEFIIIDDGSTDSTFDLIRYYRDIDSRITSCIKTHSGLIDSLNLAAKLARGRWLSIMDCDDVAVPEKLMVQLDFLSQNPDIALLGSSMLNTDENLNPVFLQSYPQNHDDIIKMMRYQNCFSHPAMVINKEAFLKAGGYRTAFLHAEDFDLSLRLLRKHKAANITDPLIKRRIHKGSISLHNLRQQVVSAIAARIASQLDPDPFEKVIFDAPVSKVFVTGHGVDESALAREIVRNFIFLAQLLIRCNSYADATVLFNSEN
ncbi:MAG: glycosyltransferase, partial [Candidatus Margulisiibacteriota bacterium]